MADAEDPYAQYAATPESAQADPYSQYAVKPPAPAQGASPNQAPSFAQGLAAPADVAATIGINTFAPVGAAIESLATGKPYEDVRSKWIYSPTNPVTQKDLQTISQLPVLKQIGQVIGWAGQKLSDTTGGAASPTAATDAINLGLLGTGAKKVALPGEAVAGAAEKAAAAGLPGVSKLWNMNAADSVLNRYIINNAWAQQIGESGAFKLTQNVLNRANNRITSVFDYIRNSGRQYTIQIDQTLAGLNKLGEDFTGLMDHPTVKKMMEDIRSSKDNTSPVNGAQEVGAVGQRGPDIGRMDAEQLGNWSSRLGKAARNTEDFELKSGLFKVKDQLEDLIQAGLPDVDKTLYAKARAQYKALHGQLLANSSNLNTATGDVNAANMGRFLQNSDTAGYALGRKTANTGHPGYDAARFGHRQAGPTLSDSIPPTNSVTAILKAATKIGVPLQWLSQRKPADILSALGSNTTFRTTLANELRASAQGGSTDTGEEQE